MKHILYMRHIYCMNIYCIFLAIGICISYIALYTYIVYRDGESGNGNPHTYRQGFVYSGGVGCSSTKYPGIQYRQGFVYSGERSALVLNIQVYR
jgi:hypothetical protein